MIKSFLNKVGIVNKKEESKVEAFTASNRIYKWLKELDSSWTIGKDNPNCFYSAYLEALYVYDNEIRYWEDIRIEDGYTTHPIPKTNLHLEKYVTVSTEDEDLQVEF